MVATVSTSTLETSGRTEYSMNIELVSNDDEAIKRTTVMAALKKKKQK